MRALDWLVLAGSLLFIVIYGLWKGRGSNTVNRYLLAEKSMPWYAVALSIMATQASAITFISTTSQGYVDGMRFVQFYFGLPLAMVILAATAVPLFHRANVYTAYEYLEQRFDAKTRSLVSLMFLVQRGLGVGLTISAPAIVLTVILGWSYSVTSLLMGGLVILYTVSGGVKAVTWTDMQQMLIIFAGVFAALATAVYLLPSGVSFSDAVLLAGAAGRLKAVDLSFDWQNRYNIWSGLIGGMFLALSYFGTDQSQVQRYLTGKSVAQSRLSLLFNAVVKIPMQFLILFSGAIVFVFFVFERPPLLFQQVELNKIQARAEFQPINRGFNTAFQQRREAAEGFLQARRNGDRGLSSRQLEEYRRAQTQMDAERTAGARLVDRVTGSKDFNDTNYVFLSFVTRYMPAGIVGLMMAAIFAAAMSSISAEINSLATVTVIDLYRRRLRQQGSDRHYLWASRIATAFWGCYAVAFAEYARNLGALIEVVNIVGSLFYGAMLGVFVLGFGFPHVRGTATFIAALAGEAAIFYAHLFTKVSYLWYNVIGCLVVVATALAISLFQQRNAIIVPSERSA